MTSKQAIDIFKEKYPHTSPSLGLGYSEVCQYIVFADGKIQPTNPVRSEVILNTPMKRIR